MTFQSKKDLRATLKYVEEWRDIAVEGRTKAQEEARELRASLTLAQKELVSLRAQLDVQTQENESRREHVSEFHKFLDNLSQLGYELPMFSERHPVQRAAELKLSQKNLNRFEKKGK